MADPYPDDHVAEVPETVEGIRWFLHEHGIRLTDVSRQGGWSHKRAVHSLLRAANPRPKTLARLGRVAAELVLARDAQGKRPDLPPGLRLPRHAWLEIYRRARVRNSCLPYPRDSFWPIFCHGVRAYLDWDRKGLQGERWAYVQEAMRREQRWQACLTYRRPRVATHYSVEEAGVERHPGPDLRTICRALEGAYAVMSPGHRTILSVFIRTVLLNDVWQRVGGGSGVINPVREVVRRTGASKPVVCRVVCAARKALAEAGVTPTRASESIALQSAYDEDWLARTNIAVGLRRW